MRWKRKEQRRQEAREQLLALAPEAEHESPDDAASLTELHARTSRRSDVTPPSLPGHRDDDHNEQDARMHDLMRQHDTAPRPRREWLAWGRRHGTEHPGQLLDRLARQQAEADDIRARIDGRHPYRAEDRYDRRTIGNMARRGQESRQLNVRHSGPPQYLGAPDYDFVPSAEQVTGDLYRRGPGTGGIRSPSSEYAWRMDDGFRF